MIPFHFKPQSSLDAGKKDIVLPAKLESKAELLSFLQHAIPLPDYFGHNWDALRECLSELESHDRPKLSLIHQDLPRSNMPADQRIYLQLLAKAASEANRLIVVFPEDCRAHVLHLLDSSPSS